MPVRRDDDRNHRHLLTCHFFQLLLVVFLSFKRRFGSVKCEVWFGTVNHLWGNLHPLMPSLNHSEHAIFGAPQAAKNVYSESSHSRSAFISGMIGLLTGSCNLKNTHRQTLLQFFRTFIHPCCKTNVPTKWVCLPCIGFSSSICSTLRCMSVCFFYNFFPKGNELQLPCWVAPP